MNGKQLLITDLDGTLVKDSKRVSDLDASFLKKISQQMKIGVATGRSIKEIEFIEEQVGINFDVRIGFCGGLIEVENYLIHSVAISQNQLSPLLEYISKNELVFDALEEGRRVGNYQPADVSRLWNTEVISDPQELECLGERDVYKINVRPPAEKGEEVIIDLKSRFPQLAICRTDGNRIEVTEQNVTKGNALKLLKKKYDCSIMAVGDSENDLSMFEAADKSFCMSIASENVKRSAVQVIDHFYELEKYI